MIKVIIQQLDTDNRTFEAVPEDESLERRTCRLMADATFPKGIREGVRAWVPKERDDFEPPTPDEEGTSDLLLAHLELCEPPPAASLDHGEDR